MEWRAIEGVPGYEVSDTGRVRFRGGWRAFGRNMRLAPPGERVPQPHRGGYLQLMLPTPKGTRNFYIHRLVAEAFLPPVAGAGDINHKNGDKHDNRLENLEWVTRSDNILHAFRVTRRHPETREFGRRLTRAEYDQILDAEGSVKEIAERFGISYSKARRVRLGLCVKVVD